VGGGHQNRIKRSPRKIQKLNLPGEKTISFIKSRFILVVRLWGPVRWERMGAEKPKTCGGGMRRGGKREKVIGPHQVYPLTMPRRWGKESGYCRARQKRSSLLTRRPSENPTPQTKEPPDRPTPGHTPNSKKHLGHTHHKNQRTKTPT